MKLLLWMAVPICKTCIHYLPSPDGSFNSIDAKCKKIGTIDVVNGKIDYSLASSVREHACGQKGILYKPEPRLYLKELKHNMYQHRYNIAYTIMYVMYMSVLVLITRK